MNSRFGYDFKKQDIFELIKKLDKPGLEKALTDTAPKELRELSKTYYTKKKLDFLKGLTDEQQNYIERLEYELVVIHEM